MLSNSAEWPKEKFDMADEVRRLRPLLKILVIFQTDDPTCQQDSNKIPKLGIWWESEFLHTLQTLCANITMKLGIEFQQYLPPAI